MTVPLRKLMCVRGGLKSEESHDEYALHGFSSSPPL